MENLNQVSYPEQSLSVLEDILDCPDMQNWGDFHLQSNQMLEEELFKFKQTPNEPEDDRVMSPFAVSSTTSAGTLAADHDISTVPNWMTNGLSFDTTANGGLVSKVDSSEISSELQCDPVATVPASDCNDEFTEENLKSMSVKELNKLVKQKGLTKDQVSKIKYLRRTIKNRGYAQNCRIKRIKQKQSLEEQNLALQMQVETLQSQLEKSNKEHEETKKKYKQLKKFVFQANKIYLAS